MSNEQPTIAKITAIKPGHGGHYAVCNTLNRNQRSTTFTILPSIWNEVLAPKQGNIVVLSEIRPTRDGSRAEKAKFANDLEIRMFQAREQDKEMWWNQTAVAAKWPQFFGNPEDTAIWQEWLDWRSRDAIALSDIISDISFPLPFRARAIFLLLSPSAATCPVGCRLNDSGGMVDWTTFQINLLPLKSYPDLARFAWEMISTFFPSVKSRVREDFCYNIPSKKLQRWENYNRASIELLTSAPDELLPQIFRMVDFQHPEKEGSNKGFDQFELLLENANIPPERKTEADMKVQALATKELLEKKAWAFESYCKTVSRLFSQSRRSVPLQMFFSQFAFIAKSEEYGQRICGSAFVDAVMVAVEKGEMEVAKSLAELLVRSGFPDNQSGDRYTAERILEKGLLSPESSEVLRARLAMRSIEEKRLSSERSSQRKQEDEILAKMRARN